MVSPRGLLGHGGTPATTSSDAAAHELLAQLGPERSFCNKVAGLLAHHQPRHVHHTSAGAASSNSPATATAASHKQPRGSFDAASSGGAATPGSGSNVPGVAAAAPHAAVAAVAAHGGVMKSGHSTLVTQRDAHSAHRQYSRAGATSASAAHSSGAAAAATTPRTSSGQWTFGLYFAEQLQSLTGAGRKVAAALSLGSTGEVGAGASMTLKRDESSCRSQAASSHDDAGGGGSATPGLLRNRTTMGASSPLLGAHSSAGQVPAMPGITLVAMGGLVGGPGGGGTNSGGACAGTGSNTPSSGAPFAAGPQQHAATAAAGLELPPGVGLHYAHLTHHHARFERLSENSTPFGGVGAHSPMRVSPRPSSNATAGRPGGAGGLLAGGGGSTPRSSLPQHQLPHRHLTVDLVGGGGTPGTQTAGPGTPVERAGGSLPPTLLHHLPHLHQGSGLHSSTTSGGGSGQGHPALERSHRSMVTHWPSATSATSSAAGGGAAAALLQHTLTEAPARGHLAAFGGGGGGSYYESRRVSGVMDAVDAAGSPMSAAGGAAGHAWSHSMLHLVQQQQQLGLAVGSPATSVVALPGHHPRFSMTGMVVSRGSGGAPGGVAAAAPAAAAVGGGGGSSSAAAQEAAAASAAGARVTGGRKGALPQTRTRDMYWSTVSTTGASGWVGRVSSGGLGAAPSTGRR